MLPSLSTLVPLLSFALVATPSPATAVALPVFSSRPTCIPRLSGLVQTLRYSSDSSIAWKSVSTTSSSGVAIDGVKAAKLHKEPHPEFDWFVEHLQHTKDTFTVASGMSTTCAPPTTPHSFLDQVRHGVVPSSCGIAHEFKITCLGCEAHEDSASRCQFESVLRGKCVEMVDGGAKLGWGECIRETQNGKGLGRAETEQFERQRFDISP